MSLTPLGDQCAMGIGDRRLCAACPAEDCAYPSGEAERLELAGATKGENEKEEEDRQ